MSDVSIRGLKKDFDGKRVLAGFDLEVQEGELVVLLGPSGCGKTTLLRCLAGLEEASDGEILIGGKTVDDRTKGVFVPPNKRGIGVVFQSYALWPHMTVRGNVSYALKLAKRRPEEIRRQVDDALRSLNLLERANDYAGRLSGGQQQRVALARAIASQPRLMLFDEPLSNLDAKLRLKVRLDIRKLHRQSGITAVYVTHDQEEAMALADRIAVMNQGDIEQLATPEEVYNNPTSAFVADFMGFENILRGRVLPDAGGRSLFVSDEGGMRIPFIDRQPEGATTMLGLRASHLSVVDELTTDESDVHLLEGTVATRTYLGDHSEILVDVGSVRLFARMSEEERSRRGGLPQRGDRIKLRVNTEKVVGLRDPLHAAPEGAEPDARVASAVDPLPA